MSAPPEAPGRWFGLWDSYFAISYLVTATLLFSGSAEQPLETAVATAALTALVPWYAGVGRRLIFTERTGWRNVLFTTVLFGLFALATLVDLGSSFALFAVVPMIMMTLPTWPAISVSLVANLVPLLSVWLRQGRIDEQMLGVLPTTLLGIALSALMGLWISRVIRQSRERAALIEELRRNRERVARLSHEAGIAAERERLAREIHDTIAQNLTSVISLVEAAESEVADTDPRTKRLLTLAREAAAEGLAEARQFVVALTPPSLHAGSLGDAVRRRTDTLATQTGLTAVCELEGDEFPLPMAVRVVLLRVAQEAMANVQKHSGATRVEVTLTFEPHQVELAVVDDGRGFDASAAPGGYGLAGMRARVAEIGGVLTVTSAPEEGTMITVSVPVDDGGGAG
ncbi:sensor histidine kinase [Saccharothrix australiensis]|uniref:sensor histidine kinase n=1 Tax=Saccharothrix australiensis TaxID=2072 RepID=UPI001B867803|nr:sensor histidine kinase [Saccharothrix australiensis]